MRLLGWALVIPSALVALGILALDAYPVAHTWHPVLIAAATFIPLLWVPAVLVIIGLLLLLDGWSRLIAVVLLVAAGWFWGRDLVPDLLPPDSPDVVQVQTSMTVFLLNTQYGRADIAQVEAIVDEHGPDVLVFLEYTQGFDDAVAAGGVADAYPHRVGTIREDAGGTMLLSRTPLTEVERLDTTFDNVVASTTVDGREWTVAGIHTVPPQLGSELWASDGHAVHALAQRHDDARFLMLGDFNAIEQHHTMRLLDDTSLRNVLGRGRGLDAWQPTWPVGRGVPPFARIDHVLYTPVVHGWAPDPIRVEGSDHKGILAQFGELP